jgi:hypothetical protein
MRTTINIRYVGSKQSETAFSSATQIVWRPGDVHPIPAGLASKMLEHPDVFTDDDNPQETPQAKAAREAASRPAAAAGAAPASIYDFLPPGTKITMPNGAVIEVPGLSTATPEIAQAVGAQLVRSVGTVDPQLAAIGDPNAQDPTSANFAKPLAGRMANFTDPDLAETPVNEAVDESSIRLAPGTTVAAPAEAPKAAPAPGKKAK